MFSMMPMTSIFTLSAMRAARCATLTAAAWGVVTMTMWVWERLSDGDRHVTGAGRQVQQQVVHVIAPVHLVDERGQGFVQHRAAPDDRIRFVREHEPDRHHPHAVFLR